MEYRIVNPLLREEGQLSRLGVARFGGVGAGMSLDQIDPSQLASLGQLTQLSLPQFSGDSGSSPQQQNMNSVDKFVKMLQAIQGNMGAPMGGGGAQQVPGGGLPPNATQAPQSIPLQAAQMGGSRLGDGQFNPSRFMQPLPARPPALGNMQTMQQRPPSISPFGIPYSFMQQM